MYGSELWIFSIFFGIIGFFILIISPIGAIYFILTLQVISFLHGVPNFISKWVFGGIYTLWFLLWAASYFLGNRESLRWHPVAKPTWALAFLLLLGIVLGLLFGSTPLNIVRDVSPYLGYLAIFPVIDAVRTPQQAKRVIFLMAILGLPGFIGNQLNMFKSKQGLVLGGDMPYSPNASPYWGPIQGACWAVALCYQRARTRVVTWGWILLSSTIPVIGGMRALFLSFIVETITAFKLAGKLDNKSRARYMIPIVLGLVLIVVVGLIKVPLSRVTEDRYSTLTNLDSFEADDSVQGRLIEIRALMKGFVRNPIIGVGFGYPVKFAWQDRKFDTPWFQYHNGYAETLMKFGIIGTLIYAWFYWSIMRMSYRILQTANSFFAKAFALGMMVWMMSALVLSVGGSMFSNRGFSLALGVMAGLLPALADQNPYAQQPKDKPHSNEG